MWSYCLIQFRHFISFLQKLLGKVRQVDCGLRYEYLLQINHIKEDFICNTKQPGQKFYNPKYHHMLILKTQRPYEMVLQQHQGTTSPYDCLKTNWAMHP